jgi:hypothetical protein
MMRSRMMYMNLAVMFFITLHFLTPIVHMFLESEWIRLTSKENLTLDLFDYFSYPTVVLVGFFLVFSFTRAPKDKLTINKYKYRPNNFIAFVFAAILGAQYYFIHTLDGPFWSQLLLQGELGVIIYLLESNKIGRIEYFVVLFSLLMLSQMVSKGTFIPISIYFISILLEKRKYLTSFFVLLLGIGSIVSYAILRGDAIDLMKIALFREYGYESFLSFTSIYAGEIWQLLAIEFSSVLPFVFDDVVARPGVAFSENYMSEDSDKLPYSSLYRSFLMIPYALLGYTGIFIFSLIFFAIIRSKTSSKYLFLRVPVIILMVNIESFVNGAMSYTMLNLGASTLIFIVTYNIGRIGRLLLIRIYSN